ncbi:acetyltransferase (GNAT) family protein [Alicyclobacillus sacchari]|uniref:Acetyltransferase (GNAT) family protein n=1 Tax=Alicyclobacillus sacchari TaxID=392010 RepID=A0A4R8LGR6_9BACL|nr:GNAT family N-acetyltransferase [Alicyclobacillus sacchari]TDY42356.1 acetyltransferase (GNAT) family protein [Alicyclobacillus sacchari]GMA58032.1 N-acetyltransferase [Alicyclobacillus sacchari]
MNIRNVEVDDYYKVIEVLDDWWGGRQMTHLLPRLFFEHFQPTSFIVENDGMLSAFLIGFVSQTHPNEAYIHFVGVNPELRKSGLARQLYQKFFDVVQDMGCNIVRCITSPANEGSVAFHTRMGFTASVGVDYAGRSQDRILFQKNITPENDTGFLA